jgi:hypothetical protein
MAGYGANKLNRATVTALWLTQNRENRQTSQQPDNVEEW